MKLIIYYFILLVNILQIACSQTKEPISIEQVSSNYSTILYANLQEEKIEGARFYLTFNITNNTNEEVNLSFPEYIYNGKLSRDPFKRWRTVTPIYFNKNNKLEIVFGNKEIEGLDKLENKPKQYVFVAGNVLSEDSSVQALFKPYLDQMKAENKDTLHIGTISELKAENSPILQALEGDSIIISFGRNDIYIDPIPVQIK